MSGLSAPRIVAQSFAAQNRKAIPVSGGSPEAIWHVAYDTKLYTQAATVSLNFYDAVNVGNGFLSNMELPGQFPAPQVFNIYGLYVDMWTAAPVSTSADVTGNLNATALLLLVGTPVWTLTLQQKKYGPYPLTTLHSTGGPIGNVFAAGTAGAVADFQFGRNENAFGSWNYSGSVTIPAQTAFQFNISWAAAQATVANWNLRVSMSGILSRAVK